MSDVLIGIDLGTTVLKAAAFDRKTGRALASSSRSLAVALRPHGGREQSLASLTRGFGRVLGTLRRRLGKRWHQVAGLGLAAQGGSTIIADRHSGKAHTPMLLWNDQRASDERARIAGAKSAGFWRSRTWRDTPGQGLARMRWLRRTRPRLFSDRNIYVGAGEYVYFQLTGVWRQDAGNALQIGCYNARKRGLDQTLLDLVDLPLSFVAPMREGHEVHGLSAAAARRFGLPAGIPVAGPYMDHEAGYLAVQGVSKKPLQFSMGTAWVGNFALPASARAVNPVQLVLPGVTGRGRLVVQPLLTGNVTWDWALNALVPGQPSRALGLAAKIMAHDLLPPPGLVALPWFNVQNPLTGALGGGAFTGLGLHTTQEDLLRALVASMAFEAARVLAEVKARKRADSLVLGGGASQAEHFRTLFAALFAPLPVFAVRAGDLTGTRGVLHVFSKRAARIRTCRIPLPAKSVRERVQEQFAQYTAAFHALYGSASAGKPVTFPKRQARSAP